jgi:hypothetical protein
MGTQDEVIDEQLLRIKEAFAGAVKVADAVFPEPVAQETEGEFGRESLQCAVGHIEEVLVCYVVPFQKKILQTAMDAFPAKEVQYEQEVRRQTADDNLLDITSKWPTVKVEKLNTILKGLENA